MNSVIHVFDMRDARSYITTCKLQPIARKLVGICDISIRVEPEFTYGKLSIAHTSTCAN